MAVKRSAIGHQALLKDIHCKFLTVTRLLQDPMYSDVLLEDKFLERQLLVHKTHISKSYRYFINFAKLPPKRNVLSCLLTTC